MSTGSLRERRRADTVAEIKQIALELADRGPDALSLRAVAREVGVSVQALYHYFDNRDALITALVTDAFDGLADAVTEGAAQGDTRAERIVGAGLAYRRWARAHRAAFLLALGAPLSDYSAPEGGPTTQAAKRMGRAFQKIVFDGWTDQQARAVPSVDGRPGVGDLQGEPSSLPTGVLQLFTAGWAALHGFVMLEVHGHLDWLGDTGEQSCRALLQSYAETVERARTS